MVELSEVSSDKHGLTNVVGNEADTGEATLGARKPDRYDQIKQSIIDYNINKMLDYDILMSIDPSFASPVVLCQKPNGENSDDPEA